jgi:beta-glucanase (GH16 family)
MCSATQASSGAFNASVSCAQNMAVCGPSAASPGGASLPVAAGWPLAFDDEFDGTAIDSTKWTSQYLGVNANSVFLRDGAAVLHIDQNTVQAPAPWGFQVAALATNTFSQLYGWFEIRAKVATGAGLSGGVSAFWLSPHSVDYSRSVDQGGRRPLAEPFEIDIFEQYTEEPTGNTWTVHAGNNPFVGGATTPGPEGADVASMHREEFGRGRFPSVLSADFHTYAVKWTPTGMTWFFDGHEYGTLSPAARDPFHVRIILYRHSSADPNLPYPQDFVVDYVRVYALPPSGG